MNLPFSHDAFLDVFGSAAFLLGIRADLVLAVAAALLVLDTLLPSALGARTGA